jgi:predicted NAD/FAD-binding protein
MRIAIVGGGVAGLTAAWLLQDAHDVTLFEAEPRFGGHARTIEVDDRGQRVAVDAGFEFFSRPGWPSFHRLLGELRVPLREYQARIVLYRKGAPDAQLLQPIHMDGRIAPSRVTVGGTARLAQLGLVLARVAPIMRVRDTSVTVEQLLAQVPTTRALREEFLFPFLLSGWCVEPEEFRGFSAYSVLRYSYVAFSARGPVPMLEIDGGTATYLDALIAQLARASLRARTPVSSIEREGHELVVRARDEPGERFDQVILAANAQASARLLSRLRGAEQVREQLSRMEYFRTAIAVHEDPSVMPAAERDWSCVNIRHDGRHAQTTVWKPWRSPRLFRSWITFDREPLQRVHARVDFEHAKVTPRYYAAQRALQHLQGHDGVWLAGAHMHDIDSHESAVCSAVEVARRVAPDSARWRTLGS